MITITRLDHPRLVKMIEAFQDYLKTVLIIIIIILYIIWITVVIDITPLSESLIPCFLCSKAKHIQFW